MGPTGGPGLQRGKRGDAWAGERAVRGVGDAKQRGGCGWKQAWQAGLLALGREWEKEAGRAGLFLGLGWVAIGFWAGWVGFGFLVSFPFSTSISKQLKPI